MATPTNAAARRASRLPVSTALPIALDGKQGAYRSIGTHQVRELTVRRKEGPLLTSLATGDASSRLVEGYRLHPNAIKALARCGQG